MGFDLFYVSLVLPYTGRIDANFPQGREQRIVVFVGHRQARVAHTRLLSVRSLRVCLSQRSELIKRFERADKIILTIAFFSQASSASNPCRASERNLLRQLDLRAPRPARHMNVHNLLPMFDDCRHGQQHP